MNETLVSIGIVVLLVAAVGGEECHNKDFNEEHKHIEYRKNGTICRYSNGAYHCKDGNCHNTLYIKNYTKNEGNLHYTHYTFNYTGCSTRPKPPYHIIIQYQSSQKEVYDQLSNVTCELKRHKDGNDGISHYNTYNYNCSLGNCEFDWVKKTQQNAGKCSVKYHYENYKCNCNSSPYIESVRSSLYNGKYCHNEDFNEEHKHIEYQKNRTICSYSNGAYPCKDGNCHNALYTKSYTEKEGNLHYTHYTFNYIGISTNRKLLFHITIQYENSQKEVYDQLNNATCELKRDKDRNGTSHNNTYNYNCRLGNCVFDWVKKTQETETGLEKNCFVKYHYENYKCVGNPSLYNKSITDALKILHTNLTNIRPNQQEISYFVKGCSVVLSKAKNENEGGDEVIKVLEKLGDIVSKKLGIPINGTIGYEVSTSSIAFGVWNVQKLNFNGHTFPTISNNSTSQQHGITNQTITLPKNIFNFVHDINESYTSITSISYQPLKGMIANAAKSNASIGSTNIISTSIKPKLSKKLKKKNGVRISFNIPTNESLQPRCVFWKYDEYGNGTWSDDGCYIVENNPEHVQCECNHLTDFTILMTVKDVVYSQGHRVALHYITLVGCIISIIFMAIMILVILCIKNLRKNHRYMIHMNLATALIAGNISLLVTDSALNNETFCLTVSIVMFYFFLAAFCWMLCEGIFIWRAFVTVFTENQRFWKYLILGWGTPLLVVTITAAIKQEKLKSEKTCWLSVEDSTIYAFIAPALLIILLDAVVLVTTLVITYKQSKKTDNDELKTMARATLILLPLLGATWLFGVFAVNEETMIFKYLFTVLNSLQGFFLFVFYILTSKEVQKQIRRSYRHQSFDFCNNNRSNFSNSHAETTIVESSLN